jgi:hypothetical protein
LRYFSCLVVHQLLDVPTPATTPPAYPYSHPDISTNIHPSYPISHHSSPFPTTPSSTPPTHPAGTSHPPQPPPSTPPFHPPPTPPSHPHLHLPPSHLHLPPSLSTLTNYPNPLIFSCNSPFQTGSHLMCSWEPELVVVPLEVVCPRVNCSRNVTCMDSWVVVSTAVC